MFRSRRAPSATPRSRRRSSAVELKGSTSSPRSLRLLGLWLGASLVVGLGVGGCGGGGSKPGIDASGSKDLFLVHDVASDQPQGFLDGGHDLPTIIQDAGPVQVKEFGGPSTEIPAGGTLSLTVVLTGAAPEGGAVVALSSIAPDIAAVDAQVVVPAATDRATVIVTGKKIGETTIVATLGTSASTSVKVLFGAGSLVITEFRAIPSRDTGDGIDGAFIEIYNRLEIPVTLTGWTLKAAASAPQTITAFGANAGNPVVVMPGAFIVCVPRLGTPAARPANAACAWGDEVDHFNIDKAGDTLVLANPVGREVDRVDFTTVVSTLNQSPPNRAFVILPGVSTQLDGATLPDGLANDNGDNWCTGFRTIDTAGAANEPCQNVVINEVQFDPPGSDAGKEFIELAGPGGAVLSGMKLRGVGGATGASDTLATIPDGTRMPPSGIFLIADSVMGASEVPNANYLTALSMSDANASVQLLSQSDLLLDVVGYGVISQNQDTTNHLDTKAGSPIQTPTSLDFWGFSIARDASSTNTGDNSVDFHVDPTPTPGFPNGPIEPTITGIVPSDAPASAVATVTVTGTDFIVGATLDLGTGMPGACTVQQPELATCTVGPRADGASLVEARIINGYGGGNAVLGSAFTFTVDVPAGGAAVDTCQIESPASVVTIRGNVVSVQARIGKTGVTDPQGQGPGILVQIGTGPRSQDPRQKGTWTWIPAIYDADDGSDDIYKAQVPFAVAGTVGYAARASTDNGLSWVYCDLPPGSSDGFALANVGLATVTP